ncbi:DUF4097 domain-containing protein [Pleionea sediminis]|uniref:DUF4097 domain-containing protein n=1 Tax=Pleionea sediminis TaxID=2569479 RepID=UPI0011854A4C|nr:DUF4097 domain-containing protein [Pleionea sediminis]
MPNHFKTAFIGVSLLTSASIASAFDIEETRQLTLDVSSLSAFKVDASAGFLVIKGEEGINTISVEAELNVDEGEFDLKLEEVNGKAFLMSEVDGSGGFWGKSPSIDLTVTVPARLLLDVKDGSGAMTISSINNDIKVRDGSGELNISDIKGNVSVDDGSGRLFIENIQGELVVDDGSGSMEVRKVTGPVDIEDGSGSITISDLMDALRVKDGSGGMMVSDVKGHVTIDDGSGGIELSQLEQGVTILEEGSGSLTMTDVRGEVIKK